MFSKNFVVLFFFLVLLIPFVLAGPSVSSPTHPDSDTWYKSSAPVFEIGTSGTGYSYKLNLEPDTIPDEEIDSTESTLSFSNRVSGEQFFHVRVRSGGEWSDTTHFKLLIDHDMPRPPTGVTVTATEVGRVELSWEAAVDNESGVRDYKIYRSFMRDFDVRTNFFEIIGEGVIGTNFTDEELVEGRVHHYRVQAIDMVGTAGGLSRSFFAKVKTQCDFEPVITTSLEEGTLSITIDSGPYVMYYASLVLKPVLEEEIEVFKNRSDVDLFIESVDVSGLGDQEIVIDFDVKDKSQDVCDIEKSFFLDRVEPNGEWVFPEERAELIEEVTLKVNAFDLGTTPSGISQVEFFYDDGEMHKIGDGQKGEWQEYFFDWNTLSAPNGRIDLVVKIIDKGGNFVEKKVSASIKNTAIISGEASAAILTAEQGKEELAEIENQLALFGVDSTRFVELIFNADSNLVLARELFDGGINFELAKTTAEHAKTLFEEAGSVVEFEKTDSLYRVFTDEEKIGGFQTVGLKSDLVQEATEALEFLAPMRRADVFKVFDGNKTFYKIVINLLITKSDSNEVIQVVEVVPIDLAKKSEEILSNHDFEVLNPFSVIKFDIDLNKTNKVSYSVKKNFSKKEVESFSESNPLNLFESLPIVVSASAKLDAGVVVKPFDLFKTIEPLTSEYDVFFLSLVGVGVVLVVVAIIGVISFFIVLLAVLKSR